MIGWSCTKLKNVKLKLNIRLKRKKTGRRMLLVLKEGGLYRDEYKYFIQCCTWFRNRMRPTSSRRKWRHTTMRGRLKEPGWHRDLKLGRRWCVLFGLDREYFVEERRNVNIAILDDKLVLQQLRVVGSFVGVLLQAINGKSSAMRVKSLTIHFANKSLEFQW